MNKPRTIVELLRHMREEHNFHHYHGCEYDEEPVVPCTCFIGCLHKEVDDAIAAAGASA